MKRSVVTAFAAMILIGPVAAHAVVLGHTDDFEDGSVLNWDEGVVSPNPPTNVATGGPAGANDNYLSNVSSGGGSAGSKMAMFNVNQWTGDFAAAGITAISVDLNNLGSTDLDVRMAFEGPGGRVVTTAVKSLPAGSGWQSMTYPITAPDLVGGLDSAATLAGVTRMWFFHHEFAVFPGPAIVATLGVDNIQATPEPATLVMLTLAGSLLLRRQKA